MRDFKIIKRGIVIKKHSSIDKYFETLDKYKREYCVENDTKENINKLIKSKYLKSLFL